jgi:hypothetical protein
MMKRYLKYALEYAYLGLVIFLTVAVPLSAINAGERLYEAARNDGDQPDVETAPQAGLDRGAPDPEDAPDNMTPNGPCCNQPAYLQSLPLIKTTETGNSGDFADSQAIEAHAGEDHSGTARLTVSVWEVTSALGRQFTLVGAKPSGTS